MFFLIINGTSEAVRASHVTLRAWTCRLYSSLQFGHFTLLWEIPFPPILLKPYWITPVKLANGVQAREIWAGIPLYKRQCLYVIHSELFFQPTFYEKQEAYQQDYSPWSTRFSGHAFSSPAVFRWASEAKMTRDCLSCAEPIELSDGHESCVFCLGRTHAEAALVGSDCPHCGDMSLWTLRLRVVIVQGDELVQLTLPCSSSAASFEPRRKVPWVSDADLSGSGDKPAPAQCPRTSHPPAAGPLPVRFMTAGLRPSPDAQDVVSFGAMEGTEEEDDAISVAASAREEWSNSLLDYTAPHGSDAGDLHHSDVKLLSTLSKAVDELGLKWAPPVEPARSHLDEWYLQSDRGRKDTPRRPGPFFPEVHVEINSWNARRSPVGCIIWDPPSCLLWTELTKWGMSNPPPPPRGRSRRCPSLSLSRGELESEKQCVSPL